ncbi:hypothetical protein KSP39_PZI007512 [Platanthera zijinensis]|uniref:Uncharacterized protein n=1 Tax=Platanthera zijinensis TaxID=2320716 RepID=A0AAP0BPK4_9ASPA
MDFRSKIINMKSRVIVRRKRGSLPDKTKEAINDLGIEEDDWQKEKKDFLHSLNRLSSLPRTNTGISSSLRSHTVQVLSQESSPQVSLGTTGMDLISLGNKPIIEKKASVYAEAVKILNETRSRGLPFKVRRIV